jgi:hypothetical protein
VQCRIAAPPTLLASGTKPSTGGEQLARHGNWAEYEGLYARLLASSCRADLTYTIEAPMDELSDSGQYVTMDQSRQPTVPSRESRVLDRPWVIVLVLLHLGLLGIPLYWSTNYSVRTRLLICLASVAYTIFAVWVIVWAALQIMRVFAAGMHA